MKNYARFTLFLIALLAINSCRKEIKSERGRIDLISNVYFDASKNLNNLQSIHLSNMNYLGDTIIERVPDFSFPELTQQRYLIKDTLCYSLGNENSNSIILSDILKNQRSNLVENKKQGALFSKEWIPNYINRKNLSDTILFNKKYKRFEINSPWIYTRFYIYPTDTILPYSLYKHVEQDYKGRLERIDFYNKEKDIFVSLQVLSRKSWDEGAKELFEFNAFVKQRQR